MPKYGEPPIVEIKRGRGRPMIYSRERLGEIFVLRSKGNSLDEIARRTLIPKSTVYRILKKVGLLGVRVPRKSLH